MQHLPSMLLSLYEWIIRNFQRDIHVQQYLFNQSIWYFTPCWDRAPRFLGFWSLENPRKVWYKLLRMIQTVAYDTNCCVWYKLLRMMFERTWRDSNSVGVFPFRLSSKIQVKKVKKSTKAKWEFCWFLCKNKVVN